MNAKLYDEVARGLIAAGVGRVFGIPGTQTVALYESIRRHRVPCTLTTHEAGAGFAAAAWYRVTGTLAAVSVIPGPGFTNVLTSVAQAQHDSSALLVLTEAPGVDAGRQYSLQVLDQRAVAAPLVKRSFKIHGRADAAETLRSAASVALSCEPGPVLVELGADAADAMTESPLSAGPEPDFGALTERLTSAHRPLLMCGHGASGAASELTELAERLNCPVVTTTSGRGVVSEAAVHNTRYDCVTGAVTTLNELIANSDLVLALGCKFGHNGAAGFRLQLPREKLVRVDADPSKRDVNYPASEFYAARCETVLPALLAELGAPESVWSAVELDAWRTRMRDETIAALSHQPTFVDAPRMTWQTFFDALRSATDDDAIVVTDSGHHQVLTRTFWETRLPRTLLIPADFQAMGYALPSALGAGLARPGRQVLVMLGDGGLTMGGMELVSLVREGLPVTVVLFNDGHLGQIHAMQSGYSGVPFQTDVPPLNVASWASAIGCRYVRLSEDIEETLRMALQSPAILDLRLAESDEIKRRRRASRLKHPIKRVIQR